jgi:hypothetical protein
LSAANDALVPAKTRTAAAPASKSLFMFLSLSLRLDILFLDSSSFARTTQFGETHPFRLRCLRLLPQPWIIKVPRLALMSIRRGKNIGSLRLADRP